MESTIQKRFDTPEIAFEMPASAAQRHICLHADEHAAAWNVAVRFLLRGNLDARHLESAIQHIVVQNEILRTGFVARVEAVVQQIVESCLVPLTFLDLSASGPADPAQVDRVSKEEARRIFDLARPPLMRATLLKTADEEHVLLLTLHHAICDGWSVGILSSEVMKAYDQLCKEKPLAIDSEVLQYADYSVAENEYSSTEVYREHGRFWQDELRHITSTLAVTQPNQPVTSETDIQSRLLPLSVTRQIEDLARREDLTFFEVVLAAFALSRMQAGNQREAAFATPLSGRNSAEIEKMLGTFVNYLPVRFTAELNESLPDFRRSVARRMAEYLAHAEFRIEELLSGGSQLSSSIFEHVFICQRDFVRTEEGGGVQLSAIPSVSPGALHAMTFFLVERADGWRMSCEIDPIVYKSSDAEMMLDRFERTLHLFSDPQERTVNEVIGTVHERPRSNRDSGMFEAPASEAQERYWMMQGVREDQSALHLRIRLRINGEFKADIARRALQALVDRHETLRTTLIHDGDALKQHIHPLGATPDFEVRCLLYESASESAAEEKKLLSAEDHYEFQQSAQSWLRVLIVEIKPDESVLAITLPHLLGDGWSLGLLLREFYASYDALSQGRAPSFEPMTMQYADYASQEEELTKSGEMEARLAWWKARLPAKLQPLDLPTSPALSATGESGMEVITLDPILISAIKQFAREQNVTLFTVYGTALLALLAKYSGQAELSLITFFANRTPETEGIIGPFAMPILVHRTAHPDWNYHQFLASFQSGAMEAFENAVPLVRCVELTNLQSRLGRHAANQINFFYQSAFVAETKSTGFRAVPMPVTGVASEFEWQIGVVDYGSSLRVEFQYDVNLWSAAAVRLVTEHYQHLLSEWICHPEKLLSRIDISTDDEKVLEGSPEQLLPILRRALHPPVVKEPDLSPASIAAVPAEPVSSIERTMVDIWREVFRNSEIGVNDNFFELGGYSLTLARIRTKLQQATEYRISTADIFAAPTIAALAQRLKAPSNNLQQAGVVALRKDGAQPPLFLISQSMIFRRMVQSLHPDLPVYSMVMQDEKLKHGAQTTFEEIAAWYVSAIRSMRPHGPYRLGGWCVSASIAYEIAQQLRTQGETVDLLLLVDGWAPGYWRDPARIRRFAAKSSFYADALRRNIRVLMGKSFRDKLAFLSEKWRLSRAAMARQIASVLNSCGIKMEARVEEQDTFVDAVVDAASRRYMAKPGDFGALIFRSDEQPQIRTLPKDLGWSGLLKRQAQVISLPGDHRGIFDDPGAQILAEQIGLALHLPGPPALESDLPISQKKPSAAVDRVQPGVCRLIHS